MKNNDLLTQLLIFLASITTTIYAFFSKDSKEAINRTLLLGKFLGSDTLQNSEKLFVKS